MADDKTFREKVIEKFLAALGEAEVSPVQGGNLYRWALQRGPYAITMHVTINSPEHTNLAHIMISDGSAYQIMPIVTITVYSLEEADALLQRIAGQWKSTPPSR